MIGEAQGTSRPAFHIDRYGCTFSITLRVINRFAWVRKGKRRTARLNSRGVRTT